MSAAPPARLFFALWPDARVRGELARSARALQARCGGRALRAANMHLTLVFVGDVAPVRLPALCEAAAGVAGGPVELLVDRAVYWPHNRIAWAGPAQTPAPLAALVAALEAALAGAGFRFDRRPYVPHVTLVRNARCRGAPALERPVAWRAEEFVLAQSVRSEEGAAYAVAGRWPLAAARDPA